MRATESAIMLLIILHFNIVATPTIRSGSWASPGPPPPPPPPPPPSLSGLNGTQHTHTTVIKVEEFSITQ